MLRQERMGAGIADQKDLDAQFARAIVGDGKFEVRHGISTNIHSWIKHATCSERSRIYR